MAKKVVSLDNLGDGFRLDGPNKKIHVGAEPVLFYAYNKAVEKNITEDDWHPLPDYWVPVEDSHNGFSESTGQYTIPESGVYSVSANVIVASNIFSPSSSVRRGLHHDGSFVGVLGSGPPRGGFSGTIVGRFVKGSTVEIKVFAEDFAVYTVGTEAVSSFSVVRLG